MNVSYARHTAQPFQKGEQFEFINQKLFYWKQGYTDHFFLNSGKKWAIINGQGTE